MRACWYYSHHGEINNKKIKKERYLVAPHQFSKGEGKQQSNPASQRNLNPPVQMSLYLLTTPLIPGRTTGQMMTVLKLLPIFHRPDVRQHI